MSRPKKLKINFRVVNPLGQGQGGNSAFRVFGQKGIGTLGYPQKRSSQGVETCPKVSKCPE